MISRERPNIEPAVPDRRRGRALAMVWVLALVAVTPLAVWLQGLGPPPASQPAATSRRPTAPTASTAQAPTSAIAPQPPAPTAAAPATPATPTAPAQPAEPAGAPTAPAR